MVKIERILACSDLSAHARVAIGRAAWLCSELGAQLELLHVAASSSVSERTTAEAELHVVLQELRQAAHREPRMRVEMGDPADQIQVVAAAAQLVVVGATSRNALRRLVVGTTADRLIARSSRPVLVVKMPAMQAYRRVLVAMDFSPYASAALALALAVAPGAEITVVHAVESAPLAAVRAGGPTPEVLAASSDNIPERAGEAAQRLDALLAQAAAPDDRRLVGTLVHGDTVAALLDKAAQIDADLIVAARHGRSVVETLVVGSVTRRLLHEADCDVLVSTGATTVGFDADALPPRY